jgi:hypothetical protein
MMPRAAAWSAGADRWCERRWGELEAQWGGYAKDAICRIGIHAIGYSFFDCV